MIALLCLSSNVTLLANHRFLDETSRTADNSADESNTPNSALGPVTAADETYVINEDSGDLSIDVFALTAHGEPWTCDDATITFDSFPAGGGVITYDSSTCMLLYQPSPDYFNETGLEIDYDVEAPDGHNASGTITIQVMPVNDPPEASDYTVDLCEDPGASVDISPGVNISDIDSGLDELTIESGPSFGTANVVGLTLTYTPNVDFNGEDSITYSVTDDEGLESNSATITITVLPNNDVPTADSGQSLSIVLYEYGDTETVDLTTLLDLQDLEGDVMEISILSAANPNFLWDSDGTEIQITPLNGNESQIDLEIEICNAADMLTSHDPSCDPPMLCSNSIFVEINISLLDSDSDGIPDSIEDLYADGDTDGVANKFDTDSDDDGIDDGDEDLNLNGLWDCEDSETNWLDPDTDDDGILDGTEVSTDPLDIDSDDDGLTDGPGDGNMYADICEDCNANGTVDANETSPTNPDSDGDCLLDGVEVGLTAVVVPVGCIEGTDQAMTYSCQSCCGNNVDNLTFQLDADGSTTTDPLNPDSDNDDYSDGHEDAGLDGLYDTNNLPEPFLVLASSCYEQDCVGTSCFGGFDSDPNSVCSPDCWDYAECDCDAQADPSQAMTPNGANYCADLWNALCAIPNLNNQTLLDYVTIGSCDEFTVDGELPSISTILDNNSINDPGLVDDGDNIPQSCDNCNQGYYLAYNNDEPCPSGSYIGSGTTANTFQSDDDGDGIGNLCDDCPDDDGGLKGCKDVDACNYNPFASCENQGECEYSFPETSGVFDNVIYACASDMSFDLIDALIAEYGFGTLPEWGDLQEFSVLIDGDAYSWDDLESLDLTDIGQDWCSGVDVEITLTHSDLDAIYCQYDDVFETVSCDVCGATSSLEFELVVNHQADGESTGMTVCLGVESLETPIPNPFNSFSNCNAIDDYNWTWTVSSGDGDVGAAGSLLNPMFGLDDGLLIGEQVVFNISSEIEGCATVDEDFTVTISDSSVLEFALEDELSAVTEVQICENADEQDFHFEILTIGGGIWEASNPGLQDWSSASTPLVSDIGGGVYAVAIDQLFADGNTNQVILHLDADEGCPANSDTINFVLTTAPSLTFVSDDLIGDSLLVLCETASNRSFNLIWGGPVTWELIDSDLNADLSFSTTDQTNSADIEVNNPLTPGTYEIVASTLIEQVPYGCSNISDSFDMMITGAPTITSAWGNLDQSFYCAPTVLDLSSDFYTLDENDIWGSGEQMITVTGFNSTYVLPLPASDVEEITFNSSMDDFMPLDEDIQMTIEIDDGADARSCQAVSQSILIHAGATPLVDYLELISLNSPFDGMEVTGLELDTDILCQGADLTVKAHPDLQVIGSETAMSEDEVGTWTVQGDGFITGGTLLEIDDLISGSLDVEMTYAWEYMVNGVQHTCTSELVDEIWTIEADTACTGCPIFELPGPAFVACASDLASNSSEEGGYIRWGYFDEDGLVGGFFDDGLEQQTIFYPTLDEIELYGDDESRLFAFVSAYEDLHCGCLSLGENSVFTDVEELIVEGIQIFPNPSSGLFQVNIPEELLFVQLKFQVFDSMGRMIVDDVDCALGSCTLDLRNEADGMYIVRIINAATHAAHKKFIVKQ